MSAPLATLMRETELMVVAGRQLAWGDRVDMDTMEGLIRKVARKARASLLDTIVLSVANDIREDGSG